MKTDTFITVASSITGSEKLSYTIEVSEGEKVVTLTLEDINFMYYEKVKTKLSPILNTIISNLIRSRDFLGLQLNFEFGNITPEQYEELETEFLTEPQSLSPEELKEDVEILMKLSNKVFNAEEISTMFNCSLDSAEQAVGLILMGEADKKCLL